MKTISGLLKNKQSETALSLIENELSGYIEDLKRGLHEINTARTEAENTSNEGKIRYDKDLALLRSILESQEDINIYAIDHHYNYTAFTDSHKKTMKKIYGVDIMIGSNNLDLISNPEDKHHAKQNFDRVLRGENFICCEDFGDEKFGRISYECYHSPIRVRQGAIIGAAIFVVDITKRMTAIQKALKSEEKLRRSEEKYRLLAENSSDGILHIGADGVIQYASPAYKRNLGYPENDRIYQIIDVINDIIHPSDREALISTVKTTIESKKEKLTYTYRIKRENGDYIWHEDSDHFQYDSSGNYQGCIVISRNITERKQIEMKLHESLLKAEAGNRLKTAFMQNISHEIRTPLNGILGFAELLADSDISSLEKENYNMMLKKSSDRLISTITDYMDISLIETGNIELKIKTLNISNLISEIRLKYQEACEMKNLNFSLLIPDNYEKIELATDFELLSKCIYQLMDNAVKFTKHGTITFGFTIKSGLIEFFIRDSGIGIAAEAMDRIFEAFEQENMESTRGYEGNGLGLTITRQFLKQLGGEIRVESVKDFGSTFYFHIPLSPENTLDIDPVFTASKQPGKSLPVILIAEDDLMSDIYLENILRPVTTVIYKAGNGKEAMEMCAKYPDISLVLMDLKMPVMDGFEATRQIRTFRKQLPIIAISAYALAEDKKEANEAGINDFLPKPVSKKELFEKLKKYGFEV
ncbi:MAG: PAS domain-containing hybrid sensor histidine kinase/response regulator [Bacteroidales bacterium]|jgi:PAS domain S-box-containing protein